MIELLHYDFMVRSLLAGLIIAVIAPLIGIFLVLRRYSLITDTLAHVSFAGVAFGVFTGISPIITALVSTILASFAIERLRMKAFLMGESALALFMAGSLGIATIFISLSRSNLSLHKVLFGSVLTVTETELWIMAGMGIIVIALFCLLYKQLFALCFDEESAFVNGIPVERYNLLMIVLSAIVISIAIPIVGVLLIGALTVIPVLTALQLKKGFLVTVGASVAFSVFSVLLGLVLSFVYGLSTGGTIVLVGLAVFMLLAMTRARY